MSLWFTVFFFKLCSKLDHPGIATLIAAHAKPPTYMFFFKLYESPNLAQKLHVEEWIPTINVALMMAMQLGIVVILFCTELVCILGDKIITWPGYTFSIILCKRNCSCCFTCVVKLRCV